MPEISVHEAKKLIDSGEFVILDIRTPAEFRENRIKGAKLMNLYDDFRAKVQELDSSKKYIIYCRTAARTKPARRMMEDAGLKVYEIAGGILGWIANGYDVET